MPTDPTPQAVTCKCGGNLVRVPGRWWVHQGYGPRCDNAEPAEPSPAPPAERVIEVAPQKDSVWTPEKEQEMLEKAAGGVERMNPNDNEANMIAAVLRETLPEVAPQEEIPRDWTRGDCPNCKGDISTHNDWQRGYCQGLYRQSCKLADAEAEICDRGLEIDHWKSECAAFRQTAVTLQKQSAELESALTTMREERDRAQEALRGLTTYFDEHYPNTSARAESLNSLLAAARAALNPASDRQPEGETK